MEKNVKIDDLKTLVSRTDSLYKSMASGLGDRVYCKECGRTVKVDVVYCLRNGWPKCCSYTMSLNKDRTDD